MTKQELRAFRKQSREIKELRSHLKDITELYAPIAAYDRQRFGGETDGTATEQAVEKILSLQQRYEAKLNAYADERIRIERSFEVLTPDERAVMRAYYFDNLSWEAVAEHIDISYRHVHRLHSHALQMLKEQ